MCIIIACPLSAFGQGLRAQIDRDLYRQYMQEEISNTHNLTVLEGSVDDLYVVGGAGDKKVMGIYMGELLNTNGLDFFNPLLPACILNLQLLVKGLSESQLF